MDFHMMKHIWNTFATGTSHLNLMVDKLAIGQQYEAIHKKNTTEIVKWSIWRKIEKV